MQVRLYAWRQSVRHTKFLDEAYRRGLVVVAVYEMGTAEDSPVGTRQARALLRARVQARLRVSRHRAIVAWLDKQNAALASRYGVEKLVWCEECSSAFDGMQPTLRHVPPSVPRFSMHATRMPSWPALMAAG